jgi:hypothetical protein
MAGMAQEPGMANVSMTEGSNMDLILQLPMAAGFALLVSVLQLNCCCWCA